MARTLQPVYGDIQCKGCSEVQVHDTIYGRITTPDWPDDIIVRSLSALGEWSYLEQQILARLIRAGDVLWDGGAFLGTFGIGVAQIAERTGQPLARLIAVEPGAELRPFLADNLQRNVTCGHLLVACALGSVVGRLMPADVMVGNHGALSYHATDKAEEDAIGVDCLPLWHLRAQYGDYDILKLDVEGMEVDALRGDFEHIRDRKPVIWAECNEAMSSILLLEALVAAGYAPHYLAFPAFRQANFHAQTDLPYPMAYEAALLAAPPDRLAQLDVSGLGEEIIVKSVTTSWDLRQALWATPRWAQPAWTTASRAELIALLGHVTRGESLGAFLNDAPKA
ncbi:MAG: FkbM family methyltransferase [Methylobacterium sp.]|nr:FkbM family methyltransferase [Methylobacterium sp.]